MSYVAHLTALDSVQNTLLLGLRMSHSIILYELGWVGGGGDRSAAGR